MTVPGMIAPIVSAVGGRDRIHLVASPRAAGARHVLHHDHRVAGNVPIHMPRNGARIDVEAAAGCIADYKIDGLAGVEVGGARTGF